MLAILILPLATATNDANCCPTGSNYAYGSDSSFGNAVQSSYDSTDVDNSLDSSDSAFAVLNTKNSYIIIDMNEPIYEISGDDFYIWGDSYGGWAAIYVSDSPDSGFVFAENRYLRYERGIDFENTGYASIRYVKIVNIDNTDAVNIDAIGGECVGEYQEVPEFGVVAGAVALIGALGIFAFTRRKN